MKILERVKFFRPKNFYEKVAKKKPKFKKYFCANLADGQRLSG